MDADKLLALANWIGNQTGATVGFLTEAANTVGAQMVRALPGQDGLNAQQMLSGGLKAAFLLNCESEYDSAVGQNSAAALDTAEMVVTMSPFKTNMDFSDVLLPIAPFSETSGSFVNAEGRLQSFHGVVKPAGDARPAWKVLRVLGNLMDLQDMNYETSQDVLARITGAQAGDVNEVPAALLSNVTSAPLQAAKVDAAEPCVASIYQLDSLVRRAPSLQMTADARAALKGAAR